MPQVLHQEPGMGHTAYLYNTPYGITRVFYRIGQIRPYYTITNFAFFAFSDEFQPRNDLPASSQCHYYLKYITFYILKSN